MEIKNSNTGTIHANNVDIGDKKYVTNIFDGLSFLLTEYKQQLDQIHDLIIAFKPKTAFDLLSNLESRINESNTEKDNKITSKLLFLKALCKRELEGFTKEDSAQDFIKAYNLNKEDDGIKHRACIEYLNLGDIPKAIILADHILNSDEYNGIAWIVKTFTSDNIKQFIQSVPRIVLDDYKYQHSVIYHIISTKKLRHFDDIKDYGLQLTFDFERYKEVKFHNKPAWMVAIDLLISKAVNNFTLKYISGENFIVQNDPDILSAVRLLEIYINTLESTEISNATKHQKFYLNYLKYVSTNDDESFGVLIKTYDQLEKPYWFYTHCFCQILNHKKDFSQSLNCLVEYELSKGELHSEFFLFKSVVLHFLSKDEEIETLFQDYLNSVEIIDERYLYNIISTFFNFQLDIQDNSKSLIQLEKVLEKPFTSNDLKILFKVTIELRCLDFDVNEVLIILNGIKDNEEFDTNCKNLIAENLEFIGKTDEALNFMETYINKSIVSESLRYYIILLHRSLHKKEDTQIGKSKELLLLLKFWRENNMYLDEQLLCFEHNLYSKINDLDNLEQIDQLLHSKFPENEQYLYFYLSLLERKNNHNRIKEISKNIPTVYESENFGIGISGILLRNRNNTRKGFEILYKLASDSNNTEARKNYFGGSLFLNEYFENYDSVSLGNWVRHIVDGKIEKRKILKSEGIQKDFIGKKIGEKFIHINSLTNRESKIEIIEIFNDALNLFRDISDEAQNPINELGFVSLEIPPDINDFPKFLIEQFGKNGSEEKTRTEELLNNYYNYQIGYLAVVYSVFKRKFVDAYLHLTGIGNSKFTTIPNSCTIDIDKENLSVKFVLDFSSLMLFYFLEKELKFKFKHKFIISYNTKNHIDSELIAEKNSPESTLSMNITSEGIERYIYPEGIKNKRIEFLKSILNWIDDNCEIDLVEEQLDVVLKLSKKDGDFESDIMKNMIDSLYLSIRENHRFISSDISVFSFNSNSNLYNNFLNPEKFLLTYYTERCDSDFYRFLLRSNYIGIDIKFETLKREFIEYIGGRENYYLKALENLQYSVNNNPNVILTCINFFNFLNNTALPLSAKRKCASEVLTKSMVGMQPDLIQDYRRILNDRVGRGYPFN